MIEKFRRKFIAFATGAVFLLLLVILGTINIVNFSMVANEADEVTSKLAEEGGRFERPALPGEGPFQPGQWPDGDPMGPHSPEMPMSARYFTVRFNDSGQAEMVQMELTANTINEEDAIAWAKELAAGSKGWTRTNYRYRTYTLEKYTYVSVLDFGRELGPSYRVLWGSLIGSAAGMLITFLVLIPVSKILVKPLETSIKKQQRFVSDASHELKTPLTIISANNEIIALEQGESESTKAIEKQVGRLTAMVKNLNTLARMDEEEIKGRTRFNLASTALEIVDGFRPSFQAKNIEFEAEIPAEMPVIAQEDEMKKLLSILLDNAVKYAKTKAEFHLYQHGERTSIKVINDADGIEEGSLDRIFERFYRSDVARASSTEGSGLGLSIAKAIIKNNGGRIYAKGENGLFIIKAEL